jgi:hypothetical protein
MLSLYMPQFMPYDKIEFRAAEELAVVVGYGDALRESVGIGQVSPAGWDNIDSFERHAHVLG